MPWPSSKELVPDSMLSFSLGVILVIWTCVDAWCRSPRGVLHIQPMHPPNCIHAWWKTQYIKKLQEFQFLDNVFIQTFFEQFCVMKHICNHAWITYSVMIVDEIYSHIVSLGIEKAIFESSLYYSHWFCAQVRVGHRMMHIILFSCTHGEATIESNWILLISIGVTYAVSRWSHLQNSNTM